MKRILVVISTSFVPYGGLTTVMMNYYRSMNKEGLIIDFASTNTPDKKLITELEANGGHYYCLGARKKILSYRKNLKTVLCSNRYDIIHVNANSTTAFLELSVAKKCGVKNRIMHNHNSICNSKFLHALLIRPFQKSYTTAIACSDLAGDWLFGKDNYILLNNAIDTEKFSFHPEWREKIRSSLGVTDGYLLGHVGKINEQKNHIFLIDIFAEFVKKCPRSKMVLIGDGPLRNEIQEKVKSLQLENDVIFVGMVSNVNEYLSALDCLVFPSKWEGLPLSLIEAQSTGLKCATSLNVTKQANITGKVVYISLDEAPTVWADTLCRFKDYDREAEFAENANLIKQRGYDVHINSSRLRQIYIEN